MKPSEKFSRALEAVGERYGRRETPMAYSGAAYREVPISTPRIQGVCSCGPPGQIGSVNVITLVADRLLLIDDNHETSIREKTKLMVWSGECDKCKRVYWFYKDIPGVDRVPFDANLGGLIRQRFLMRKKTWIRASGSLKNLNKAYYYPDGVVFVSSAIYSLIRSDTEEKGVQAGISLAEKVPLMNGADRTVPWSDVVKGMSETELVFERSSDVSESTPRPT